MNIEETKSLKITCKSFEIRAGKTLTTLEMTNSGKPTGRDLVIRNIEELDELISALNHVYQWSIKQ